MEMFLPSREMGLALTELFLFFTTILQNFSQKPVAEPKEQETKSLVTKLISVPVPFKLCFIPR